MHISQNVPVALKKLFYPFIESFVQDAHTSSNKLTVVGWEGEGSERREDCVLRRGRQRERRETAILLVKRGKILVLHAF